MSEQNRPECPVCAAPMNWDEESERYVCEGIVQHCYIVQATGDQHELMLMASDSGEDAELFATFPFGHAVPTVPVRQDHGDVPCPVCGALMEWNKDSERYVCQGMVQHCYTVQGEEGRQELMLTASDSGEDAALFSTYPFPGN